MTKADADTIIDAIDMLRIATMEATKLTFQDQPDSAADWSKRALRLRDSIAKRILEEVEEWKI